jgi:hypothetical protein
MNVSPPHPFSLVEDVFAFANETVWHYAHGAVRWERADRPAPNGERYTRRCFVLARSAVQFWRFARFAPEQPRLSTAELAARIREVTARPLWNAAAFPTPVIIPGFAHLRAASTAEAEAFRAALGGWWHSYFRWGNLHILEPLGPARQRDTCRLLHERLASHNPVVLWLINFPSLSINHAVVATTGCAGRRNQFEIYDPNLPDEPQVLTFSESSGQFSYPPTFYFRGGRVGVRPAFHRRWL